MDQAFLPINIRREVIDINKPTIDLQVPVYHVGSNNLWVFVNGKKEFLDYDYYEVSNVLIKFNKTIPVGSVIELLILRIS
jgi:hypothetical protein